MERKLCIVGTGGFAKETLKNFLAKIPNINTMNVGALVCFMVDDIYFEKSDFAGIPVIPRSTFDPSKYQVVVAIGDPNARKKVVENLPKETQFTNIIHPSVFIPDDVEIGEGAIIAEGVILTTDITIGEHCQLNLHTTVGHDTVIGDYFTSSPGVRVSGNCTLGNQIQVGANAAIKEKISIADNIVIGMGAMVIKNLVYTGTYVGVPAQYLEKK